MAVGKIDYCMSICKAPFVGMTIDPQGEIELCCNNRKVGQTFKTNIKDIDDLEKFFLDKSYQQIRDQFETDGWEKNPACINCLEQKNKGQWVNSSYYDNYFNHDYKIYKNNLKVRFLEITPSNVCNQSCSTCSSYFSTSRGKVEKTIFGSSAYSTFKLSDSNLEKIYKLIPQLEHIMIKGGEPFADRTNYYILKRLIDTNPNCGVHLVSNMHSIPEEFLSLLKELRKQGNKFLISASIDGVGDLYEWIRGTKFEETLQTMQDWYLTTEQAIGINVCVSMYNVLKLDEIRDFFSRGIWKNLISHVDTNNHVTWPDYAKPDFKNLSQDRIEYAIKYIEMMDTVRNKKLFDIQPELKEKLYENILL